MSHATSLTSIPVIYISATKATGIGISVLFNWGAR